MSHEQLSHKDLVQHARHSLEDMLKDPFLHDLTPDSSSDEVTSLLALEQGRAITVNVRRFDEQILSVIVLQGATVDDLICGLQSCVTRRMTSENRTIAISWRSVWRRYALSTGQTLLSNRKDKIASLGIGNHSEVHFVKKLKPKNSGKRQR